MRGEAEFAKAERAEARLCFRQLNRIGIKAEQPTARLKQRQNFLGMPAVSESAINRDLPRLRIQSGQHFRHHDWAMRPGRRFAGRDYFGNRVGIAAGVVLLVFLLEAPRIFPAITNPTRWAFVRQIIGHISHQR